MPTKRYLMTVMVVLALLLQATPLSSPVVSRVEAASYCDWVQYVMDVTVPDGTILAPNTPFTKTWRLKNIGTCTWTTAYALVYGYGDMMSAPPVVYLPHDVPPGATVDVSVQMTTPP
ncbi:MAG: NBR1-Ig-like domain-containing protein, partial [Chloroflexota bacterium]